MTAPAPRQRRHNKEQYYALRALGRHDLPAEVTAGNGRRFRLVRMFKHDFFAATGLYEEVLPEPPPAPRLAVLKMGRIQDFLGLPMRWLARALTAREVHAYELLAGQPGVPGLWGVLPDGTGFLHEYVPGRPLEKGDRPNALFFDQLQRLLDTVHGLNMAYVDLNKRQNILLGEDGRPYLIDFQISFGAAGLVPHRRRSARPPRGLTAWILRILQEGDRYHVAKHKFRLRPDLCTPAEAELAQQGTSWTRLHRKITHPLQGFRRRTLDRIRKAAGEEKGPG